MAQWEFLGSKATHKHVLCLSTSKLRKSSSILSPCGTRISHSQSKLFAYVSGCWGDENCPVLDVNKPPQPGIPTSTKQKKSRKMLVDSIFDEIYFCLNK